ALANQWIRLKSHKVLCLQDSGHNGKPVEPGVRCVISNFTIFFRKPDQARILDSPAFAFNNREQDTAGDPGIGRRW
ncbi:MAG: hypothetical protein KMY50_06870, partial [Candidatus Desulforudis sp.]|nr:hypothetical protein [Desulforudis sp.]